MKLLALLAFLIFPLWGKTLKLATVAPEGTTWGNNLKEVVGKIVLKTQGRVKFKVYYGGVVGDEIDVLRKIRVGQMQGGLFTGLGLGEVYKDLRVMEIPFSFKKDRAKLLKVLKILTPLFNKGLEKNGFKNLGLFEIGNIYLVSTKKIVSLKELRGSKVWSWKGDRLAAIFSKSMGVVPVSLQLPDVLSALSTGVVDAAYNSPMGVLAFQWSSKIKYLVDIPAAYSIGAVLVSLKEWKKIAPKDQALVENIMRAGMKKNSEDTLKENVQALKVLRAMGVEFIQFSDLDKAYVNEVPRRLIPMLQKEKILSSQVLELFKKAME